MKFVLANCGTRGDVEPYVDRRPELVRRGHDVRMAVAPNDSLASSSRLGLLRSPTGRTRRRRWTRTATSGRFLRQPLEDPGSGQCVAEVIEPVTQCWAEVSRTLTSLADGADLLLPG